MAPAVAARRSSYAARRHRFEHHLAVNRKYLTDAVRSFGDADLRLTVGERDAIRLATMHGRDAVVLLMPVRLTSYAA